MKFKNIFSIFILFIIMLLSIIFLSNNTYKFSTLLEVKIIYLIIISVLVFLTLLFNGIKTKYLLESYKINLTLKEWLGLSIVTTMGNYLTPFKGGASLRAVYLKKNHKFPYTSFLATTAATYIISFFAYGLFGLIITLKNFNITIFLIFLIILLLTLLITLFSVDIKLTQYKLINHIIKIINDWNVLRKEKSLLFKLFIIEIILIIIASARIFYAFKAFNYDLTIVSSLIIGIFSNISMIGITPGSIGIKEATIAFSSKLVGKSLLEGTTASILDRILAIIIVFVLGPIFSYILFKKNRNINVFKPSFIE